MNYVTACVRATNSTSSSGTVTSSTPVVSNVHSWKTAVDRAIDSMCMKVDQHVVRGLDEEILGNLITLSVDNDKCTSFFAQDPRIREKRVQLEARLERLERAQALISSSV